MDEDLVAEGFFGIDDKREGFVFDSDFFGRFDRGPLIPGRDGGHGVAHEPNRLRKYLLILDSFLPDKPLLAVEFGPRRVRPGVNIYEPRDLGFPGVDLNHPAVRDLAQNQLQ